MPAIGALLGAVDQLGTQFTKVLNGISEVDGKQSTGNHKRSFLTNLENITKEDFLEAINSASKIRKDTAFETFNLFHMQCAEPLINALYRIEPKNLEEAISFAKKQVNSSLVTYVLCVVLRHRDDAIKANLQIPSHVYTNPEAYFDMTQINQDIQVQRAASSGLNANSSKPIFVEVKADFTASDLDPEHRVAYFREDLGINLHHRHWHEVYPFVGTKEIVDKDRRGELFYYMHQQVVARYNFERLSNNLCRAKAYANFREPIDEAYYPKLDLASRSKLWCPRQAKSVLTDLYRDDKHRKLTDLEHWRDRLYEAVDRGYVYVKNEDGTEMTRKLDPVSGINELGNTVEAVPSLSWNFQYYGDMHNTGHLFISYCHDPDFRFREDGSVMSHSEAALRDPMFYRWHVFVDDIFQQYKATLPAYTVPEKDFPGIEIANLAVTYDDKSKAQNIFNTYWQTDTVDISQGILNKSPETEEKVYATFSHLQHDEFTYSITVNNTNDTEKTGTVRIFYAPKYDETKTEMTFNSQRKLFIELDKFTSSLKPGSNIITRKSTSSSVTIPFKQSFLTINESKEYAHKQDKGISGDLSYCGCGWPQHCLIGKGCSQGFSCILFAMITDYNSDKVNGVSMETECCVKSAVSFCGVRDKKYPDKRSMGFPFDRNLSLDNANLVDFMTKSEKQSADENNQIVSTKTFFSNMKTVNVVVKFTEKVIEGPSVSVVKEAYKNT